MMKANNFIVALVAVAVVVGVLLYWRGEQTDKKDVQSSEMAGEKRDFHIPEDSADVDSERDGLGLPRKVPREGDPDLPAKIRVEKRRMENRALRQKLIGAIRAARERRQLRNDKDPRSESSLSSDYVREVVGEAIGEVKACYDRALAESPSLGGRLVVEFTISAEPDIAGLVDEYEIVGDSDQVLATNETMADCLADTILSLEFSPPRNGGNVTVKYPFEFRPIAGKGAQEE